MSHTDYTDFTELFYKLINAMKQISQITHRLCSRYHPDGSKGAAPTRYDSVGCDEGRFIFPEELLSKAKSKSVRSV